MMLSTKQKEFFVFLKMIHNGKLYFLTFFLPTFLQNFISPFKRKIILLSPKENILRRLFETKSKITRPIAGLENMSNCYLEKMEKSAAVDFKEVISLVT